MVYRPKVLVVCQQYINVKLELKQEKVSTLSAVVNGESSYELIPINAFSDINRLLNVTAYVRRFKNNILSRFRGYVKLSNELSINEIDNAEIFLIKNDQKFIAENEKFKLLKKSLNIFIEKGLLRVKGRLEYSDLHFEPKFPLLLRDEHIAHLYILKSHVAVLHDGVESTLNHLSRFVISAQ